MKSDMLSDFIEELYTRAENDPDIKKLIAYFTAGGKDGELFEVIDKLSEFLEKQPYPELYAKKVLENDCQSVFSMFGGEIKSRLESELSQIIITYEKLIERASADQKLVDCYMSDRDSVALLYKALTNDGYDSAVKLAKEIDRQCAKISVIMDVLVEVNIGGEESKGGISPEKLEEFLREISVFGNIRVCGLMCIPPKCENMDFDCEFDQNIENAKKSYKNNVFFERIMKLFLDISQKKLDNIYMQELSMGMSDDFECAVYEGATIVRIGRGLFGSRT
jgi:hypothetical protein